MADQTNKLTLTAEDKTAAAFRSAARNMQQLQGTVNQAGRQITSAAANMATSFDVMGFSIGKVLAVGAVEEFGRRSTMRWAEVERATTRATLALGSNQKEQRAILEQLTKLEKTAGVPLDDLVAGFGKLATNSTLSVDKIIERLTMLADAAKVANLSTAEVAAGLLQAQHQFKFQDSEIQQFLDAMGRKPAGMSAMIAALPRLSLAWAQVEGTGIKSALNMVDALNVLKKDFGGTEEAAGGLTQMLMRIESSDLSEKLRNWGVANLKDTLIQAKKEGKSVLLTFTEIIDKIVEKHGERALTDIFGPKVQFNARAFHDLQQRVTKEFEKSKDAAGSVARGVKSLNENQQEAIDRLKQSFDELQISFGRFLEGTKAIEALTGLFRLLGAEVDFVKKGLDAVNKFFREPEALKTQHREELEGIEKGPHPLTKDQMQRARVLRGAIRTIEEYAPASEDQRRASKIEALETLRGTMRKNLDAPAGPGVSPFVREEARKRGEEEIRALDEQIKALKENTEQLRQNDPKKMGFTPGGGGGGPRFVPGPRGGGMWLPGGGGAEPAAFTPPGGGVGGGAPSAGAPWGSAGGGPPAPAGAPSGGGAKRGAVPGSGGGGGDAQRASLTPPGSAPGAGAGRAAGGAAGELNRDAYEQMFKGTPLAGKYDKVVETANNNNIPPSLMAGIMAHETGKGTSAMLRNRNNPAGLMDPKTNWMAGQNFPSVDEGIESAGRTIAKNYQKGGGTIGGMANIYAPPKAANDPGNLNRFWAGDVNKLMQQLGGSDGIGGPEAGGGASSAPGPGRGGANLMRGQYGPPGANLTTITAPVSGAKLSVHKEAAESFQGFVDELETKHGYLLDPKTSGGYANRNMKGGGPSQHSYGNAVDINWNRNPVRYGRGAKNINDLPPNVSDIAAGHNLSWGGDWKSLKDPMHFEWRGAPGAAKRGVAQGPPAPAAPAPAGPMAGAREPVGMEQYQQMREELERPIKMNIETPEVPNQLTPQFRRASGRNSMNRDYRDQRWQSYADIGAA